jgi:hypothetical protein
LQLALHARVICIQIDGWPTERRLCHYEPRRALRDYAAAARESIKPEVGKNFSVSIRPVFNRIAL